MHDLEQALKTLTPEISRLLNTLVLRELKQMEADKLESKIEELICEVKELRELLDGSRDQASKMTLRVSAPTEE
jgi:hypothetical protein